MSSIDAASSASAEVKAYLTSKNVAAVLERFIASLIAEKPDDVLLYLEAWAREERTGEKRAAAAAPDDEDVIAAIVAKEAAEDSIEVKGEDAASLVRRTWLRTVLSKAGNPEKVAAKIIEILLLQHGNLKRTDVFDGADLAAAAKQFGAVLELVLEGNAYLDDEKALDLVADYPIVMELDAKVLQYVLSAAHMAISMFFSREEVAGSGADGDAQWSENVNHAWNIVLSEYAKIASRAIDTGRQLMCSTNPNAGEPAEEKKSIQECEADVKDSWSKTAAQLQANNIIAPAFGTLFVQHSAVKKNVFADLDIAAVSTTLLPFLQKMGETGNVTDAELESSGLKELIAERGLSYYHLAYCQQALLCNLPNAVSGWGNVQLSWRKVLTNILARIEKKFFVAPADAAAPAA